MISLFMLTGKLLIRTLKSYLNQSTLKMRVSSDGEPDSDSLLKQVRNRLEMSPDDAADSKMYGLSQVINWVEEMPPDDAAAAVDSEMYDLSEEEQEQQKVEVSRNWDEEMPPELISLIFTKVGPIDILLGAQFVCTAWQKLSKEPHFYRSVDLRNRNDIYYSFDERSRNYDPEGLVICAVNRSAGQLVEFSVKHVGTDAMLRSITKIRSPLKCLRLVECHDIEKHALMAMAKKLPLLEELEILHGQCSESIIRDFGLNCPQLKSFRLTCTPERFGQISNDQAFSVAQNMPGLHHLDLFGNPLSDTGLIAILDRCLHLKSLDCRRCCRLTFGEDLFRRCVDRNIDVKLPDDCTVGCGFDTSDCDAGFDSNDYYQNPWVQPLPFPINVTLNFMMVDDAAD